MKIFKTANYKKIENSYPQKCEECGNLAVGHNGLCQKCQEEEERRKERYRTANYKKMAQRYKSDEDIASEFSGMQINNIDIGKSGYSGWIELFFPEGEEHVGGGANEVTDRWIKYPHNGKIAFENWYPENIYNELVAAIENKLKNNNLLNSKANETHMDFVQKNIDTNFKNREPIDPNKVR